MQSIREDPSIVTVSPEHRQPRSREYLPLDTRIELCRIVSDMIRDGVTYRQVQNSIFAKTNIRLSKGTISAWARGIHRPTGRVNWFCSNPSPELAYVIGVVLGDGNLNIHGYNAEILLSVTDYDFAKEFSRCLAKTLSKERSYRVRRSDKRNRWIVQGASVLLYRFLDRPWQDLKPWIQHCEKCTAVFLRAFYDGEGCISGRSLTISNTRRELLNYIRYLLERLGIEASPLYVRTRAGTIIVDPRTHRAYFRKRDCFSFGIRRRSIPRFRQFIGFTIQRKQTRLRKACLETG
ncbi:MAG TPA: LAGLIDADG family homing endonuclease [Candidatus Angelobacter sp.]|nr:LAGLIDADG family homing endonuclease [Candidatus Angelobacter sp.]